MQQTHLGDINVVHSCKHLNPFPETTFEALGFGLTDRHTVILVEIITPASADYEYRRDRLLKPPTDPYLPQRPRLFYIVSCVKEKGGRPNLMRRLGITYSRVNVPNSNEG